MNLMDAFRNLMPGQAGNPAINPAAQNPAMTGNVRLDQSQVQANPGADPSTQVNNMQAVEPPVDPLEAASDIWKLPEGAEASLPKSVSEFAFQFKPEDIQKNARQIDFTKGMPQDILEAALKGGPEGAAAMMKAMNFVGQQAFINGSIASARITEAGVRNAGVQMENNLSGAIKRETTSNMLREDNPLFNSPAVQPIVAMLEQQASAKYPTASPQQITEHVRKYFTTVIAEGSKHLGVELPGSQSQKQITDAKAGDFSSWDV